LNDNPEFINTVLQQAADLFEQRVTGRDFDGSACGIRSSRTGATSGDGLAETGSATGHVLDDCRGQA